MIKYYILVNDNDIYPRLRRLNQKIPELNKKAEEWCKKIGGTGRFSLSPFILAGKPNGIEFLEKPKDFRVCFDPKSPNNYYFPKPDAKTELAQWTKLECITQEDFASYFNFKSGPGVGKYKKTWVLYPSLKFLKDSIIMHVYGAEYNPIKELKEISLEKVKELLK